MLRPWCLPNHVTGPADRLVGDRTPALWAAFGAAGARGSLHHSDGTPVIGHWGDDLRRLLLMRRRGLSPPWVMRRLLFSHGFLLGVAAPAVLPVPFSTGLASGLTCDSRVGTMFAFARFLSDFAQFPVVLPPVLFPFRFLTSDSLVFLTLFGCLRKFWGRGCLCLCGGVHLFLENPARLFRRVCLLGLGLSVGVF